MCITSAKYLGLDKWNWDGDVIVYDCVVPSSRPVVGRPKSKPYDIDVREFLVTDKNAVVKQTIREDLVSFLDEYPGPGKDLLFSRSPGSFDARASAVSAFVSAKIRYETRKRDPWQFPDETIWIRSGDCEDRAFLAASLLLALDVSSFNLRVALGKVAISKTGQRRREYGHAWVMYKTEAGRWTVIDPVPVKDRHPTKASRARGKTVYPTVTREYLPHFLFNDRHLWEVRNRDGSGGLREHVSLRRRWERMDPSFAGDVHRSIIETALASADLSRIRKKLLEGFHKALYLFGPIVDDIDRGPYDPREHFDNGYIEEGWKRAEENLGAFDPADPATYHQFALAAHAIADFYAHSTYACFAAEQFGAGQVPLCDPGDAQLGLKAPPFYGTGSKLDLSSGRFTINSYLWKNRPIEDAVNHWDGRILSGRYAQPHDTQSGLVNHLVEGLSIIPADLLGANDFYFRAALPHHNEIAVDEEKRAAAHRLFTNDKEYREQFDLRKSLAIRHIQHEIRKALTR